VVTLSKNETSKRLKLSREYQFVRKIGEGGMGQVHLAKTTMIGEEQLVAIKILDKKNMPSIDTLDRFHREAKLLQKVKHSHIVSFGEYWENPRYAYLVMEFVDGVDLQSYVGENGILPVYEVLQIFSQISEALEYMYNDFHMFHRDLKPANIQILPSLKTKAMLIDFGNAKVDNSKTAKKSLTMISGQMAGTPGYIAPEVDFDDYKQQDDVFAIAASMLFCLLGHNPFEVDNNVIKSWQKIKNREYDLGDLKGTMLGHWLEINVSAKREERMTLSQAQKSLAMMLEEEPRRQVSRHFVRTMSSDHKMLAMITDLELQNEIDSVIEHGLKEVDKLEKEESTINKPEVKVKDQPDKEVEKSLSAVDRALPLKEKEDKSFSNKKFIAFSLMSLFLIVALYYIITLA